ncbi:hypothetical protein RHMOL_Rhmol10G0179400 [Rhododendron molle]|uniref:Uncharacterized protein n=1 Tax=Rhododendron molle TaxID=49168 RepID=A0ACC0M3S4_RHOML|nr:hypothetical protein RHMOL_Rhmol10G0179400 [Rhododendron molle]
MVSHSGPVACNVGMPSFLGRIWPYGGLIAGLGIWRIICGKLPCMQPSGPCG